MKKKAILLYNASQIEPLLHYLALMFKEEENKDNVIIAIGADVEFALKKNGILFTSGNGLRKTHHNDAILFVEKLGREVLDNPTFSFFLYRGVHLKDVFMPALQNYLLQVLYFVDIITTLAQAHPEYKEIILFSPTKTVYETGGTFARLENQVALDAARFVSKTFHFEVTIIDSADKRSGGLVNYLKIKIFSFKRWVFGLALSGLNSFVCLFARPRKIRILATDYWKNMSPLLDKLPESELVQLDREESFKTGFAMILKHRMRFVHIENYIPHIAWRRISAQEKIFIQKWERVQKENAVLLNTEFMEQNLKDILLPALQMMVIIGGRRAVEMIEGAHSMLQRIQPDVVWVRASVSAQIHFPILCYVAKLLHIPSVEVQHGILYLGPGSFINRPAAEYIATYGNLSSNQLKKFGYSNDELPEIGSPRFDVYQSMQARETKKSEEVPLQFTVACIAPAVLPQSWSDSYEIVDYFFHLAKAISHVPNARAVIKLRPGHTDQAFFLEALERTFLDVPYRIAQSEPMVDVFRKSDVVVAIYSTTVLEGLISGKPVIFSGFMDMHHLLGEELRIYEEAGALVRTRTTQELTKVLVRLAQDPSAGNNQVCRAVDFMRENYSFDGKASERLANLLRKLSLERGEHTKETIRE